LVDSPNSISESEMNCKIKTAIVLISFLFTAYTWPWEAPAAKNKQVMDDNPKQQDKISIASVNDGAIGVQPKINELAKLPVAKTTVPEKVQLPSAGNSLTASYNKSDLAKPSLNDPLANLPVSQAPVKPDVQIVENQIQDIIALNRGIKQTQEVQRIVQQAQIHKMLLSGLKAPMPRQTAVNATDADEMIRQEKIRLISQETEKNRKIIESIRRVEQ